MPDDIIALFPAEPKAMPRSTSPLRADLGRIDLLNIEGMAADPALSALVERGWSELVAAGHAAPDAVAFLDGDTILVARDGEGTPVGALIHRHTKQPARTFIAFGYVRADQRRQGLYSRLYARLVAEARAAGSAAIESEAYPGNEAILGCAERQGRSVSRLILQAKL